jgi:hypothetical protein
MDPVRAEALPVLLMTHPVLKHFKFYLSDISGDVRRSARPASPRFFY